MIDEVRTLGLVLLSLALWLAEIAAVLAIAAWLVLSLVGLVFTA